MTLFGYFLEKHLTGEMNLNSTTVRLRKSLILTSHTQRSNLWRICLLATTKKVILQRIRTCKYWMRSRPVSPSLNGRALIFAVRPSFCGSISEQVSLCTSTRIRERASKWVSRLRPSLTQDNQKRTHIFIHTHSRRELLLHLLFYIHAG